MNSKDKMIHGVPSGSVSKCNFMESFIEPLESVICDSALQLFLRDSDKIAYVNDSYLDDRAKEN